MSIINVAVELMFGKSLHLWQFMFGKAYTFSHYYIYFFQNRVLKICNHHFTSASKGISRIVKAILL